MRIRALALLAAALLPLPLLAQTYNYTYTGNDFNTDISGPYTTSDFVSVTFAVSAPLADSTVYENSGSTNLFPLSWSFSDGVQSDNNTDPGASVTLQVVTNSSGQITNWYVGDQFGAPYEKIIESYYAVGDTVSYDRAIDERSADSGLAYNDGSASTPPDFYPPGSWSKSVSYVPEGSSFPLLVLSGAALLGVGLFCIRKRAGTSERA